MLLARTRGRERELGLYAALGATRLRIIRPILFETLIVGVAAALLALLVTALTFDLLLHQVPPVAYGAASIRLDVRVAVFALTLGVVSGLVFAIAPAWRSTRADVLTLVKGTNTAVRGRSSAFGHPMVAVQVALAIVLVFGAVIAGRAFVSVLRVPLGFSADNLLVINASPNPFTTNLRDFYTRAVEALGSRGDVLGVGAGASVPTDGFGRSEAVESSSSQRPVDVLYVLPGYLETIGMPLVRGRRLTSSDVATGSSAVLSDSAARALFPNEEAVGAIFRTRTGRQFTVVGVVGDVPRSLSRRMDPVGYALPPPTMTRGLTIVARMRSRGPAVAADVRREIVRLAPGTPVMAVWWSDTIDGLTVYQNPRFQTLLLATFAGLALALTGLGIFAVVAFAVAARRREMGVRLAIGAPPRSLVQLVVRQALTPVVIGMLIGLLATQWLRPIVEAQLYEVNARDPVTLAAAAVTVAAAAFLAAYLPARHASRVDPIAVLRAE
jgi:putative ABC transport system permease protein